MEGTESSEVKISETEPCHKTPYVCMWLSYLNFQLVASSSLKLRKYFNLQPKELIKGAFVK